LSAILEVQTDAQVQGCYPVMAQLRPHVAEAAFLNRVRQQRAEGYRLVALREGETVRAVAGFRVSSSLALGRHLYVDDLVTDEAARSRGHGAALLRWLEACAAREQCAVLHLDSQVIRYAAHRFYLNQRMDLVSYHFLRRLDT